MQGTRTEAERTTQAVMLGNVIGQYRARWIASYGQIAAAILLSAFAVFVLFTMSQAKNRDGSPLTVPPAVIMVMLLLGVAAVLLAVSGMRALKKHIILYDRGIQANERSWRWDEITSLTSNLQTMEFRASGIPVGSTTNHEYTLRVGDQKVLTLNSSYERIDELGQRISEKTAEALWHSHVSAFERGETLTFGKVSLDRQGLRDGKNLLRGQICGAGRSKNWCYR